MGRDPYLLILPRHSCFQAIRLQMRTSGYISSAKRIRRGRGGKKRKKGKKTYRVKGEILGDGLADNEEEAEEKERKGKKSLAS